MYWGDVGIENIAHIHPPAPHPNHGTYVSPPHVTTSYGTWGGAIGTQQNNGLPLCNTRCAWAGGTFLRSLRKVSQAHPRFGCVLQELGWKYT